MIEDSTGPSEVLPLIRKVIPTPLRQILRAALSPRSVLDFLFGSAGEEYGIGPVGKMRLLVRILSNASQPWNATTFPEQLTIVREILLVPKELEGVVAEFGCYKGGATASLSIACAMTGRRLVVFDSFEGLPEPTETVTNLGSGTEIPYRAGDYCGTLDEVKRNVRKMGDVRACEFVKGFFDSTLPLRDQGEQYVLIFEDADLPSSVRTVIQWTWARLNRGCKFFCHEARDLEVVELFFDDRWWRETLGCKPPGFVGSGLGLPIASSGSCLGYAIKA